MRTRDDGHVQILAVDGVVVAQIEVADSFGRRLRGLMLRRPLPAGLLLVPERSVHGMWMRVPLDVASVDAAGTVLAVSVLRPWRVGPHVTGTHQVLEAPVGSFEAWGVRPGARLSLRPVLR